MIELKHKRTARTLTYQLPDSTFVEEAYPGDVCYDNWDGRGDGEKGWRKCDLSVSLSGGAWRAEYLPYKASMPLLADGTFSFHDVRALGPTHKNIAYTITPQGAASVPAAVEGSDVVYAGAYGPGIDLVYRIARNGVNKLVRIDPGVQVVDPFVFNARLPQGAVLKRRNADNEYVVETVGKKTTDSSRVTVIEVDGYETYLHAFQWRSGPTDGGVLNVDIERVGDEWVFTKHIPAEWSREYPIEIDLSATGTITNDGQVGVTAQANYAACVDKNAWTTSDFVSTSGVMFSKRNSGGANTHAYRTVISFANTVPAIATVSSVKVKFYTLNTTTSSGLTCTLVSFSPANHATPAIESWAIDPPNTGLGITGSTDWGASTFNCTTQDTYTEVTLNATGLTAFTKNGTNGYCTRETTHDMTRTSMGAGDPQKFTSIGYAGHANPPVQTITYSLPAGNGDEMMMLGVGC